MADNSINQKLLNLIDFSSKIVNTRYDNTADYKDGSSFLYSQSMLSEYDDDFEYIQKKIKSTSFELIFKNPLKSSLPPISDSKLLNLFLEIGKKGDKTPKLADSITINKHNLDILKTIFGDNVHKLNVDESLSFNNPIIAEKLNHDYDNYLSKYWMPWSQKTEQRNLYLKFYKSLVNLNRDLDSNLSDDKRVNDLSLGMGMLSFTQAGQTFQYPIFTSSLDFAFNKDNNNDVIFTSRGMLDWRIELSRFLNTDSSVYKKIIKTLDNENLLDFSILSWFSNKNSEKLQKILSDNLNLKSLKVEDDWYIFSRSKNYSIISEDLHKFRDQLVNNKSLTLPSPLITLLSEPDEISGQNINNQKLSNPVFHLPSNNEQNRIITTLDENDAVVVKGPPGTGKTHTIANLICHFLNQGKKVLVTSAKDSSLSVIKSMLPQNLRNLIVSPFKDGDGSTVNKTIENLLLKLQTFHLDEVKKEVLDLESSINTVCKKIENIDKDLKRWALINSDQFSLDGNNVYPYEAALEASEYIPKYKFEILDELGINEKFAPQFNNKQIQFVKNFIIKNPDFKKFIFSEVPDLKKFPDSHLLVIAHEQIQKFNGMTTELKKFEIPWPQEISANFLLKASKLVNKIRTTRKNWSHLFVTKLPWSESVVSKIRMDSYNDLFVELDQLGAELEEQSEKRSSFITRPVSVPEPALLDHKFFDIVQNLSKGKKPSIFLSSDLKSWLSLCRISGFTPNNNNEWNYVAEFISMQRKRRELVTRWNSLAVEIGFHSVYSVDGGGQLSAESQYELYKSIKLFGNDQQEILTIASELFPSWSKLTHISHKPSVLDELMYALDYHLSHSTISKSLNWLEGFKSELSECTPLTDHMISFINTKLGDTSTDTKTVINEWTLLKNEIEKINTKKQEIQECKEILNLLTNSGAKNFTSNLQNINLNQIDNVLPDDFLKIWRIKRILSFLKLVDSFKDIQNLIRNRYELENKLFTLNAEISEKNVTVFLTKNMTSRVRSSLQSYVNSINKLDSLVDDKNISRIRHDAKTASQIAFQAIPCWIMSHQRVSETLPAIFGHFDVVIVDEASQSDISSLPVILRGQKLVIVGDDKQVSPSSLGIDESRILKLSHQYLQDQVEIFKPYFMPDRSLYDLASVVFSKTSIYLKEHFRSVPPIINFSRKYFYNNELKPLRILSHNSIYKEPLVDVYINNGVRSGDKNIGECEFIINSIKKIIDDDKFKHSTIGIVSLLNISQSDFIWSQILEHIGPEKILQHQIIASDASGFQGRQKDIVFISMVTSSGKMSLSSTSEKIEQQFNVALSRARDKVFLVRSFKFNDLEREDLLRRSLIDHFSNYNRNNFSKDKNQIASMSSFKSEFSQFLKDRGYYVLVDYEIGNFKVDFVVQNPLNSAQLVIECDGADREFSNLWSVRMSRHRLLERMGWNIFRFFASSYYLNKDNIKSSVLQKLDELSIYPTNDKKIIGPVISDKIEYKSNIKDSQHKLTIVA